MPHRPRARLTHPPTRAELCTGRAATDATTEYITATLASSFDACVRDMAGRGGATPELTDALSSLGERWSARIMADYMTSSLRMDAPFCTSDELIVTDGVSGGARPLLDLTRARVTQRLVPLLERGATPIVTGFFGASPSGLLTTLGRGGSDLSAAVLGHALDAEEVALYKVEHTTRADGWMDEWRAGWVAVVHDADPSATISSLSYEEAAELGHFAKKVLHPETVFPAVDKRIPIAVRNTNDPGHPGTCIGGSGPRPPLDEGAGRVQTITRMQLTAYEQRHAPIADVDVAALHVAREEACLVVLVGSRVMALPGITEAVTGVLKGAGIPVQVPRRVNGSAHNFSVLVPESARANAVQLLHKSFVVI